MDITKEQILEWEKNKKVSKLAKALLNKKSYEAAKSSLINIGRVALPQLIPELISTARDSIYESEGKLSKTENKFAGIVEVLAEFKSSAVLELQKMYKQQDNAENKLLNINDRFFTKGIIANVLVFLEDKSFLDVFLDDLKGRGGKGVVTDIVLQKRAEYIVFLQKNLIIAVSHIGDAKAIDTLLLLSKDMSAAVNQLGPTIKGALKHLGAMYPEKIIGAYKNSKSIWLLEILLSIDKINKSKIVPEFFTGSEKSSLVDQLNGKIDLHTFTILAKVLFIIDPQKAVDLILKKIEGSGFAAEPEALFKILGDSNDTRIIEPLLKLSKKITYSHSKFIAPTLKRLSSIKATKILLEYIDDENALIQETAIKSMNKNLARIEGASDKIIKAIEQSDNLTRMSLIEISGYTKDIRIVQPILKAYSQKSVLDYTECVSKALLTLNKNEEIDDLIREGLNDRSELRLGWVFAAGVIKSKRAATKLIGLYENAEKKEKKIIVEAIGKIKTPESKEFYKQHKPKCYIATAIYGSYDSDKVQVLRQYRDDFLLRSIFGAAFVKFYYSISPFLSVYFSKNKFLNNFGKSILDILIKRIKNGH